MVHVKSLYACLLASSFSHRRVGAQAISVHEHQCTVKHIFSIIAQCLATRVNMAGTSSWYNKEWHHLQNKTPGTITLGGASGAPAEILLNMREDIIDGMRVSRTTLPRDNEDDATEGSDKSQGHDGTDDVGGVTQRHPKSTAPYLRTQQILKLYNQSCGKLPAPQQPKMKPKRNMQEERRGQHRGLRSQPKDHASPECVGRRVRYL